MKSLFKIMLAGGLSMSAFTAQAAPVDLGTFGNCNLSTGTNGIAVGDVTGNNGGASNCFGTMDGNTPGPSGDGFILNGVTYDFVAKEDTPPKDGEPPLTGANIGLDVTPKGGALNGDWSFDEGAVIGDFLIVLKAANSPGYAVWLFEGAHADSFNGTWLVAWNKDLSHLGVYSTGEVPVPAAVWLFGSGLLGLVGVARRKNRA